MSNIYHGAFLKIFRILLDIIQSTFSWYRLSIIELKKVFLNILKIHKNAPVPESLFK